jgi:1-acyl-sn-glycerol-3-phosphate acyltransferase
MEQRVTLFNTPVLSALLRAICLVIMRLIGWKCPRPVPPDLDKCVVIVAPHTSNWDFALFLVIVFATKMRLDVLIKNTLFIGPVGWFLRYCGGVPVERTRASALVNQMVRQFETRQRLNLLITPEGTRSARTHWKTGFYHIAKAANVPIVIAYLDTATKTVAVHDIVMPSDDMDGDMAKIYALYDSKTGLKPQNYASPNRPGSDVET